MSLEANGNRGVSYFTVDLHLHTNRGSADSNLAPDDLVERAAAVGIGAVCITEHDTMWDVRELAASARERGVLLLRGMEVTTDMGHIGVFGMDGYLGGIYKLAELRRVADRHGAILIANHPFRYRLDARMSFLNSDREPIDPAHPERAAKMEIFGMVDAVEALNGACSEEENLFALKVAARLGLAVVAGSDSHSAGSIGCVTTLFSEPLRNERELVDAIRARRSRAGRGLLGGAVAPFELPGI
ncbi:MAG TPA: PHP domain-containing protein [Candidatus Binataceae bacterium]|nr:PHP domain-containing protein [Candidatus Binataceae bacterium]